MKLPLFTSSPECHSGAFCVVCRDPGADGDAFRNGLSRSGWTLPADGLKACPHGKVWGGAQPLTAGGIARGVVGLVKAGLGVDAAGSDVRTARLLACSRCANWTGNKCALCGCYTAAKVRIAGEACPLGWWGPVPPARAE